jgi:hypothetical protein
VPSIIDLLVKIQLIDERQHDAVMSRSRSSAGGHIVQQVAEMGYATEGTVARAISVELGLPRIDIAMTPPEPGAVALLDVRTCVNHFVLPVALRESGELLWLAMADPTDTEALGVVKRRTQKRVRPAVAGPTEILRAVRTLYAAPTAGTSAPEQVEQERLAAIEINAGEEPESFEVVNVSEEIDQSNAPLRRIAEQLGVEVPPNMPSRSGKTGKIQPPPRPQDDLEIPIDDSPPAIDSRAPKVVTAIPPKTDPRIRAQRLREKAMRPPTMDELFATFTTRGTLFGELSDEDLVLIEALGSSMEKGALVMRALAELCVEKGIFTREEMRRRNQR